MTTREQVLQALQSVNDPEWSRSVVELNLIKDIVVKQDSVSLTYIVSAGTNDAGKDLRRGAVLDALQQLQPGEIRIRFRDMTEFERQEVEKARSASKDPHAPPSQAGKPASSILSPESGVEFIAVASGKGGVGKSTVTVNLAVALARRGKKVGIVDADIYGFSVPDMMGIEETPQLVNERIVPVERFGVKVISMGFFVQDNAPVIWRGPMLGKMLRNFFHEVDWGDVEIILLDLPPGTGDVALDVHQMIPHSQEIIVTTPHATAAFVAARAGAMARSTNHELLGVVENMAYYECGKCGEKDYVFGRGGGAKLADELHTQLLAQLPLGAPDNHPSEPDYAPSVYKADSPTGQLYLKLADAVLDYM
ncbi:ATP-binding protein [Gordoniibacillus kamchatkensis]|uniref:Iron-sulfur cluster carrier protein n=1 Tax=Gordoniibacillus kamchatkensis TaxID=1590651 RepID=A0ABR5AFA5_9BACL|nr:Mrp/NBP35 family ATP-binding protein [Paenibacillus sp. VKM B-2647]KIL39736.1 ATP-binding protein [Paenibacillus sp. VKM B-2647]